MITWKSPQFPEYSTREKHGFLSKVNLRNNSELNVLFCEECSVKSFIKKKHWVGDCDHSLPEEFKYEHALYYADDDVLEKFNTFHPIDQYRYISDLIRDYEAEGSFYVIPLFCYACHIMDLVRFYDGKNFYICGRECHCEYCDVCVLNNNVTVSHKDMYECICRKHDTLYDALYVILFIENYYEN